MNEETLGIGGSYIETIASNIADKFGLKLQ
jgi:hypothetical protein